MRKVTTRSLLVLLILMSIGSYVFLNAVATQPAADAKNEEVKNPEALEHVNAILPDVILLKKVIEVGKRIIPAS